MLCFFLAFPNTTQVISIAWHSIQSTHNHQFFDASNAKLWSNENCDKEIESNQERYTFLLWIFAFCHNILNVVFRGASCNTPFSLQTDDEHQHFHLTVDFMTRQWYQNKIWRWKKNHQISMQTFGTNHFSICHIHISLFQVTINLNHPKINSKTHCNLSTSVNNYAYAKKIIIENHTKQILRSHIINIESLPWLIDVIR